MEMPISEPSPNTAPSLNRVEAFVYTTAASIESVNNFLCVALWVRIASECFDEYFVMCSIAASIP